MKQSFVFRFKTLKVSTLRVGPLIVLLVVGLWLTRATTAAGQQAVLDNFDPSVTSPSSGCRVLAVVVQPDGKILIGGEFTTVGGVTRNNIARVNPDGTLDAVFNPNADDLVTSIALQADGKILVGGAFFNIGGQPRFAIARLDGTTGAADSLNPNLSSHVFTIAVQSDEKILIGGNFTTINGLTRLNIARLDASGALDSFNPHTTGLENVRAIVVQPDGKVLVGGDFSSMGGQTRNRIARLDPTSGLADSFDPGSGIFGENVLSIAVQTDGKILAGGNFTTIGGQPRRHIARLDATSGAADSFNPNADGNSVLSLAVQANGKILASGDFGTIGGQQRLGIARLDAATGAADSFDPTVQFAYSIAVQADGKILVGGSFVIINGQSRNHIARFEADGPTEVTLARFTATGYDDGVFIEWQTGFEVDNLGFNIYREQNGLRALVNHQLIAGSALLTGSNIALGSGRSYQWWDKGNADCGSGIADCRNSQYWLEDVDLSGVSSWHGPFFAAQAIGKQLPPHVQQARTLASLSIVDAASFPLESRAGFASPSAAASQVQSIIASDPNSVKLAVKREAWYRVAAQELFDAGLDPSTDARYLQLFVDGKQQAMSVTGQDDGRLDSTDVVEFYGTGVDSPFSDLRTYYLVPGKQPGLRTLTLESAAHPSPSVSFPFSVERRDRSIYFAALLNGDRENFFGAVISSQPVDQSLTLNHIATCALPATLTISLQGVTQAAHTVAIQLNGSHVGQLMFSGQAAGETTFSVSPSVLREGENQVTFAAQGGPSDVSLVAFIRLTYQHAFTADNGVLRFSAGAGDEVGVDGFASDDIQVLDVTDPYAVQELKGYIYKHEQSGFGVSLRVQGKGPRSLLALTRDKASRLPELELDTPSDLRSSIQGADLLIITQRDLAASVQGLKAFREKQGLSVKVVDVDDIYDQFSFGQKTPQAVRDFIGFARTSWKKPARYVLFFGDASLDPKNYLGLGGFDLVPTRLIDTAFMETSSDDWLADFTGDGIADVAIGRLPVRTPGEAQLLIKKIISYEQSVPLDEALLVSDQNDGFDFEAANARLIPLLPPGTRVTHLKRAQLGDQAARDALIDAINRGQRIVNYAGHGSVNVWRGGLLTSDDALQLQNREHLAIFVVMNCLNAYFQDPTVDSLGEALLKSTGGAVAVWASSAMTLADGQARIDEEFYRQVFGTSHPRLGDAAIRAKAATLDPDVRRSWILLADPTMRVR